MKKHGSQPKRTRVSVIDLSRLDLTKAEKGAHKIARLTELVRLDGPMIRWFTQLVEPHKSQTLSGHARMRVWSAVYSKTSS